MALQSHHDPDASLFEHLEDIRRALQKVLLTIPLPLGDRIHPLLERIICFHDIGKATSYFQAYIANPKHYSKRELDQKRKRHAKLGFLVGLNELESRQWTHDDALVILAVILCHHGDFPTQHRLETAVYDDRDLSQEQFQQLDWQGLTEATGQTFQEVEDFSSLTMHLRRRINTALKQCGSLSPEQAASFRLLAQLVFSIFLEVDKVHLAVARPDVLTHYRTSDSVRLPGDLVETYLLPALVGSSVKPSALNRLRNQVREEVRTSFAPGISTVTLPTGLGKTLCATAWMLEGRKVTSPPKTIIVLPFLSIIDQTVKTYRDLLADTGLEVQEAHSLARLPEEAEAGVSEVRSIDFLSDTWQAPLIITTFDQFLYALLSSRGRHQLRFHNLVGAQIIIDEIQALPPKLWKLLDAAMSSLSKEYSTRFLVMSATQPGFFSHSRELISNPAHIYRQQHRYQFLFRIKQSLPIDEFITEILDRARDWASQKILIVLNTRASARAIFDALLGEGFPVYLLSTDLVPLDRKAMVNRVKDKQKPFAGILVSTQCIEAGVDIDMDFVIRDFAPLDSLIQVAGRCNRNGFRPRGTVEVVRLLHETGREFSAYVYSEILREKTLDVLDRREVLLEEDILPVANAYFSKMRSPSVDKGADELANWLHWKEAVDVRALLRGDAEKIELIVDEKAPGLRSLINQAMDTPDRWDRKRALKRLAPNIAEVQLSIWVRPGLEPDGFSSEEHNFRFLNPGLYKEGHGLDPAFLNLSAPHTCLI